LDVGEEGGDPVGGFVEPGGGGVGGGADVPRAVGGGVVPGLVEAAGVEGIAVIREAGRDAAVGGWEGFSLVSLGSAWEGMFSGK
jgi:hypothetical protein